MIFYSKERKGHEIYDGIQDTMIEARNYDELIEKVKSMNVEIISVDLIRTEGKHRRIRALLTRVE